MFSVKRLFLILTLILITTFLLSCEKKIESIKIGFAYELTGRNSSLGRDAMYGALLAIDEINRDGGIDGVNLELIIKDDKGDPSIGVSIDNELIDEGCIAIIGHGTSNMADPTIENANTKDFILFSPTISTYSYENDDDNFFRIIPSNRTQGMGIGEFILSHVPGDTMIFTETTNYAFSNTVATSLTEYLESSSYPIQNNNSFAFTTTSAESYQDVVTQINTSTSKNIVILGSSFDIASILQNDLRDDINIFMPVWATTSLIFNLSGDKVNNTHGINYFDMSSTEPKFLSFLESYTQTFGKEASFSSMFAYESVHTLVAALKNSNSYSTADIKESLLNLGPQNWLIDDITINTFGDSERKLYMYHLYENEFIEVIE